MLSQIPWSYLWVSTFCSVRIRVANPHLRPAQFFNLIRVATKIYASHVTPPSTQSASPIHNSIGRAFSCTVALELSNPPFAYAVLANLSFPTENLSCSFLRLKVKIFFAIKTPCCVHPFANEADATASDRDPTSQPKVTS